MTDRDELEGLNLLDPLQQATARLGLMATQGQPPLGEPPTDEELALLVENALSPARRNEVLSHVDANPALFEQWMTLLELQAPRLQTRTASAPGGFVARISQQWQTWQAGWQGWALVGGLGGLAAVLVVALMQLTAPPVLESNLDSARDFAQPGPTGDSGRIQFVPPRLRARAAGFQKAFAGQDLGAEPWDLHLDLSIAASAEDSALEPEAYQHNLDIGESLGAAWMTCQRAQTNAKPLTASPWPTALADNPAVAGDSNLEQLLQPREPDQVCSALREYLLSVFGPHPSGKEETPQ